MKSIFFLGMLADGRWKKLPQVVEEKGKEPFLFPVKAMGKMFRAKYMEAFTSVVKVPEHIRRLQIALHATRSPIALK